MTRRSHAIVAALFAIAVSTALASPAAAAPAFGVQIERDATEFPLVTHSDERVDLTAKVKNTGADPTGGTVTLEVELPGGEETFAYQSEGTGWNCIGLAASGVQHAKVVCSRSDPLLAGAEYPPLKVITALGADTPDIASVEAAVFGGGGAPASEGLSFPIAPLVPFGLTKFTARLLDEVGADYKQAGGHPFSGVGEFALAKKRLLVPKQNVKYGPVEDVKQVITEIPRGVAGSANSIPELCPEVEEALTGACPNGSVVGGIRIVLRGQPGVETPIYAIEHEFGTPAQFAFTDGIGGLYTLSAHLRAADGYAVNFELAPAVEAGVLESTVTICDFGGKKAGTAFIGCKKAGEAGSNPMPLFTNPTRCGTQLFTRTRINSWQQPDVFVQATPFENAEITGCDAVKFEPAIALEPSSRRADSPTGLAVSLTMPTEGLETQTGISQANLKQVKITFPEGMAINPSAAQGLSACGVDQVGFDRAASGKLIPNDDPVTCPESSKVGSVEIETPLLEEKLKGDVFVAKQGEVEGSLLGLFLVFESAKDGILVKLPSKVTPNPVTGQLVATVDESPEAPFSAVRMSFPGGSRATLLTPGCGKHTIRAELFPWTGGPPVVQESNFVVDQGPSGGPCPTGALSPKLDAGTEDPTAAKTSPFVLQLSREDGSQRFTALGVTTPPGLTAYLKDVPYCPDATLASISSAEGTGQAQIDHPSCPAASRVGSVIAGAGAGPEPLFVNTGKAYLAGPYKGAPLSLAVVAPAVAGPLDLGNVVVRNALFVNPETAQVSVKSDPIPTILHGLLLDLRSIRVAIDRPHFTLNPTSCEPMSVGAEVKGEKGATALLTNRFQVGGCGNLKFKPKLDVRLFGGSHRGAHPRLKGTLTAAPGQANIGRAAVTIPRSEFLDQGHIRTICTRVQFAANACPKGSIYGHATATTPLLGYPVEGPVYLRSSSHKLPDLVVDLHGPSFQPIEATVVGRIDSIKGQIRTTFENAPDVPLTKFVLSMQGGKKGLLVNSRNICASTNRATIKLTGHNGAPFDTRPAVKNGKCGKRGKRGR